ncbi:MAG: hypothetical protein Q9167_008019 [Letrouitia subvulpina]
MTSSRLLNLPHEVLHHILAKGNPEGLASWRASCRTLHNFIENDSLLWKEHFLNKFDEPYGNIAEVDSLFFKNELRKFVKLDKMLGAECIVITLEDMSTIVDSVEQVLKTAKFDDSKSLNIQFLISCFESKDRFPSLLCDSLLYASMQRDAIEHALNKSPGGHRGYWLRDRLELENPYPPTGISDCRPEQQLSAKLNCLWGAFHNIGGEMCDRRHWFGQMLLPDEELSRADEVHEYARASVYDLRRYNDGNCWGPFQSDGSQRVDWERVEAIMILLSHNMADFNDEHGDGTIPNRTWNHAFAGLSPQPPSRLTLSPDALDPYDITGVWFRIVCFLDYRDLYDFNFSGTQPPSNQPRPPIETEEEIRFIIMKVYVTGLSPPGDEDGKALPVAHFRGTAKLVPPFGDENDDSKLRGIVRLTPEGEVRWTSWSVFHGEERWRSEGVQVGGIGSKRGVIGTWFQKDFDEEGPAGPTAFWKADGYGDESNESDEH